MSKQTIQENFTRVGDGNVADIGNRENRRSADEVLLEKRNLTVGSGLNQLDKAQKELDMMTTAEDEEPSGIPPPPFAVSSIPRQGSSPRAPQSGSAAEVQPTNLRFINMNMLREDVATSFLVVTISILGNQILRPPKSCGEYCCPHWLALLAFLMALATLVIGVNNVPDIRRELWLHPPTRWRVPLTDVHLSVGTVNKFANSAQVREKGLKILQYVLRAGAYSGAFSKPTSSHLKDLSKMTSISRRFFKFGRWVKHFEDLAEAAEQESVVMRALLYLRIGANFGADWAEDVCSLERMGVLPKNTLSTEFMLFAEYCQLALALVEVIVTTVRLRKEEAIYFLARAAGAAPSNLKVQRRSVALVRLELVKFVSDIGKAIFDCEFSFSHEGIFIGCSLFSAFVSTHKNVVKVLKASKSR